jgi:acetylornithine/N-succinyldiaminopimelate aminotransferase
MATTHKAKYRDPFAPVMPGVEFVKFNDVADLRAKFSSEVCAILIEAVQGEGGVCPITQEFIDEARALTLSTGALLVADEIQCGMGRTGKWCAYQNYDIHPDITTLAKPLAGGLPDGRDALHRRGRARLPSRDARQHLRRRTAGLRRGLRRHRHNREGPLAGQHHRSRRLFSGAIAPSGQAPQRDRQCARHWPDGRGRGRLGGSGHSTLVAEMLKRHILINCTSDTVLRFLPPFILKREDVDTAIRALDDILTECAADNDASTAAYAAEGQDNG